MKPLAREELLTLPNVLTLLRMGSIPILVAFMYMEGPNWAMATAILFVVSGLTDLLDGWLARKMKKVSIMGQYLDPLADKLLVASMLVMLVATGRVWAWVAIIILCREIAVTGLRAVAVSQGFDLPSDMCGKWKTALQMLAVLLLVLHYPISGFDPHFWGTACLWLALLITCWSGLGYFLRFRRRLKE
ncbi:CDP-diacylglycerol--glycerol-3-phosphate 3-phosphatidyltransferase [Dethiosulfatarculus sandiegensis]|uniref:CDP-diacylglycerol--glycerol-3-phosphate 3-phosphatidyltransferase n=1 Tax=Dethiosulfatarculus sandiegensis TaxID=1429043 RepID=UPI0005CA37F1|nr:CDP-diacylglycerol--glycerol-3-phosphate 3-phosphatidyltransferase [Dethiosulfatarculus sandiegensis]